MTSLSTEEMLSVVRERGWVTFHTDSIENFDDVAASLGTKRPSRARGPAVEVLRVVPADRARPNSLSSRYGEGSFPFHTDAAHWRIPARYMLLRSMAQSARPTRLVRVRDLLEDVEMRERLSRGVFTICNGRASFLAPILDPQLSIFRLDVCCMVSANRVAVECLVRLTSLIGAMPVVEINWTRGQTLLVDNWRCVHSRGGIPDAHDAEPRELRRALIEVSNGTGL